MVEIPIVIEQSLKNYLSDLAKHYRLDRVFLFGSLAQGTTNRDSDIDLAIFSADVTNANRRQIMADFWLKSIPYKLDIQPLLYPLSDYKADNDFIQKEIIARGIEIPIPK